MKYGSKNVAVLNKSQPNAEQVVKNVMEAIAIRFGFCCVQLLQVHNVVIASNRQVWVVSTRNSFSITKSTYNT